MQAGRSLSNTIRGLFLAGTALAAPWPGGTPALAGDRLRPALSEIADHLTGVLRGRDQDTVAVGEFTGPPNLQASSGPGIGKVLSEEFEKRGVAVKARSELVVEGKILLANVPSEGRAGGKDLGIRIRADLVDAS